MCEIELKLNEENENIKELFNFKGEETDFKQLEELFTNYINKNSTNGSNYFIRFLEHYSKCRPHQHAISKELIEYVYSCLPEQINEIQKYIKNAKILKFIIFPEEFPVNENKEQKEMFLLLQKDDIDGFISFLSKNPTIEITKVQEVKAFGYCFYPRNNGRKFSFYK